MVPHPGTPVRTHRLRPLNQPRRVLVELNTRGLPVAVVEPSTLGESPGVMTAPAGDAPTPGESPGQTAARRGVESIGEIWRVDDEWWREPINRRYIEVVMKGGKHVVLYQDLNSHEWFEQSI